MKDTMNLTEILTLVIKHDPALAGFAATDLPQAAKARIQNTMWCLERHLTHEELSELEKWTGGNAAFDASESQFWQGECCYYVFPDGSLYFRSSGDSEVWAFASDFADERILRNEIRELDTMDVDLLMHLGGHYAEAVSERAETN